LIILIPETDSCFCGLADHADVLGAAMEQLGEPVQIGHWSQFRSSRSGTTLLLQFTPLAYSRIGFSMPLLVQLWRWRQKGCRVITYFHELPFPNGRQWKRRLAVVVQWFYCLLLIQLSVGALLNQQSPLRWLRWLAGRDRLSFLPVFSNLGYAASVAEPQARPSQVVIFGSAGKRRHAHALVAASGGYRHIFGQQVRVLDVGEPMGVHDPIPDHVECLGPLPAADVFELLLRSRFGFFYSESDQFSKSGVFAAYCAAGVVPVIAYAQATRSVCYLILDEFRTPNLSDRSDQVWRQCREWASRFNASSAAASILALLESAS